MNGRWSVLSGAVVMTSVIMPEGMWSIDRGWKDYRACRVYLKSDGLCREMAEELFRRHFPQLKYEWPTCGRDDTAEAILWAAVGDPSFVGRYLQELRRLCR